MVKSPTAKKGSTNPIVYTPISKNPHSFVLADAAISSTLVRAGPTQGVHAKLKVNPIINAVIGDMARTSNLKGKRLSCPKMRLVPKTPSWYSPKRTTSIPPILANKSWLLLKKVPIADTPNPSRKKAKLIPITKQSVFSITLRLLKYIFPSFPTVCVPPDK